MNELTTSQDLNQVLSLFISEQDVKENSKALYKTTLQLFFNWIKANGFLLKDVTRTEIIFYKESLLSAGLSSLTVSSYITSVRRFYEWLEAKKLYPNIARGVRSPKRKQQFKKQPLTIRQCVALIEYCACHNKRNYAMINLMLRTGLRTIEIIRANISDIIFKGDKRVLLVHGKGRDEKDNFVILTEKAYRPIANYLATRPGAKGSDPLFVASSNNNRNGRLTTKTVRSAAKYALRAIDIDSRSISAHSLRHTTAVNILRSGKSIIDAQGVLRHSSPATTQIYTATINEEMRLLNNTESVLDTMF